MNEEKDEKLRSVDLPDLLKQFAYPVSLELSEYAGRRIYQKGFADALEFICLMANKFYTRIRQSAGNEFPILESFITREGRKIEGKTRVLIMAVKRWEMEAIGDPDFAEAIEEFCRNTYGVRLRMASFFLRMLLPKRFGTLDIHVIKALRSFGFRLNVYDALSYLKYNQLLAEIGRRYIVLSEFGEQRYMTPSEVDMALYVYDKRDAKKRPSCFGAYAPHKKSQCTSCKWEEECEDWAMYVEMSEAHREALELGEREEDEQLRWEEWVEEWDQLMRWEE